METHQRSKRVDAAILKCHLILSLPGITGGSLYRSCPSDAFYQTRQSRAALSFGKYTVISQRLWLMPSFNLMEKVPGSGVMPLVTGRIQLNSNVVVQDESLFSFHLSIIKILIDVTYFLSCTKRTHKCRLVMRSGVDRVYPLSSVTPCGGLLLVAKFRWVCCPSSQIV